MACNPSDARVGGDVELVDVSLAEVTDGFGGVKGGKWARVRGGDAVSEDSESEDEGKGLLPRGDAGASASTSRDDSSHVTGGLRGYITRVPKGEAVMLAATFTFAFQNVVAKRVERRVPPMEVVFVRSCISGAVTVFTTGRRVVECNAIVRKTNATDPDAPLDAPPAVPGEDLRDDVFALETLLGSGRFWALCFLRGVAGSIAFSLAYISLTYLTVGDSVAIFFLNPIFSSLMAIPCTGCNKCGKHMNKYFEQSASSTYTDGCKAIPKCASCSGGHCTYKTHFVEGSSIGGYVVKDQVATLMAGSNTPQFTAEGIFGCQMSETGLFKSQMADGIMGLGYGKYDTLFDRLVAEEILASGCSLSNCG